MAAADGRGQARTRLARAAVVEAAEHLFLERGYGATTMDAISAKADVPVATVYRLFSSKRGILKALLDVSIAGDDEDVPMASRPEVQALLDESDPRNRIVGFVRVAAAINARTVSIYRILVTAAGSDPDAAALLQELTEQRHQGQRLLARSLARSMALRSPLKERDAADVIHALVSPEVYGLLVVDRGWKPDRYVEWLSSLLVDQLLARR